MIFVAAHNLEFAFEIASVSVVAMGFVLVIAKLTSAALSRQPVSFNALRLGLARFLAPALGRRLQAT